jgi:hypothetical protein
MILPKFFLQACELLDEWVENPPRKGILMPPISNSIGSAHLPPGLSVDSSTSFIHLKGHIVPIILGNLPIRGVPPKLTTPLELIDCHVCVRQPAK